MIEFTSYYCEFCGCKGDKNKIEQCEQHHKIQNNLFKKNNMEFKLTEQHIKLIKRYCIKWSNCEYGAPEIDPKRPYGNSYVEGDIAKILGIEGEEIYDGEKCLSEQQEKELYKIHLETKVALEIILQTGEFKIGKYFRKDWIINDWERLEEDII